MSIAPDNLFIDTGFAQCCHYAEKACGDAVAFKRIPAEERLIAVLADGAVAETGTHAELVGRAGTYAGLWRAQRELEELDAEEAVR